MGHRLSKIYTKTGDDGTTGLGDGTRVAKDHHRVEAYGTVDELNSVIGVVLTHSKGNETLSDCLVKVQHDLFDLGGELCIPGSSLINESYVTFLEQYIDDFNTNLKPLKDFILPGGTPAAAYCHLARTICRRAERATISLNHHEPVNTPVIHYLNRLSDLLFVIARIIAKEAGSSEILWQKQYSKSSS